MLTPGLSDRQLAAQKAAGEVQVGLSRAIMETVRSSITQLREQVADVNTALKSLHSVDDQRISYSLDSGPKSNVSNFTQTLMKLAEEDTVRRATRMLLYSLDFPQRDHRYNKISIAHRNTFDWLFERDHSQQQPWPDFVDWLVSGEGSDSLYWITGKPGSGKSTLLRYLVDHNRTRQLLQQWAGSNELVIASGYFWNAGSERLQKSLDGLLRVLLRELLEQVPGLAPSLNKWRWQSYELGATGLPHWTQTELSIAFNAAMSESQKYANICLFIDGLDEFEGDDRAQQEVIDILMRASEFPNVKMCISSRPWRIFEEAFGAHPYLKLEDLTANDIKSYVQDQLISNERFQQLYLRQPSGCLHIAREVVEIAQGVFIWVTLVVRELLTGMRNEDRLIDLQKRLRSMPPDLGDFYAHIFRKLEPFYLEQANQLCQIALQGSSSSTLLTYCYVHEEDKDYAMKLSIEALSIEGLCEKLDYMERRLKTLSRGLLEVNRLPDSDIFFNRRVEFLHRTVRDYLRTETHAELLTVCHEPFNVNSALCEAFMAQIKSLPFAKENKDPLFGLLEACLEQAREYEDMHSYALTPLLDELDRTITVKFEEQISFGPLNSHWANYYRVLNTMKEDIFFPRDWNNSFLSIALWSRNYLYVKDKIIQQPELVSSKHGRAFADYPPFLKRSEEHDQSQLAEISQLIELAASPSPAEDRRNRSFRRKLVRIFRKQE